MTSHTTNRDGEVGADLGSGPWAESYLQTLPSLSADQVAALYVSLLDTKDATENWPDLLHERYGLTELEATFFFALYSSGL